MNWFWFWRFLVLWNRKGEPRYFAINLYESDHETPLFSVGYDAHFNKRWWGLAKRGNKQ
jgi:hypothetical protein